MESNEESKLAANLPCADLLEKFVPPTTPTITILLLKFMGSENGRMYLNFNSVRDSLIGLMQLYETLLRSKNQGHSSFSYSMGNLFKFIDSFSDIAILIYNPSKKVFYPHGREYIKALFMAIIARIQSSLHYDYCKGIMI